MWSEDNIVASSEWVALAQWFRCHHIQPCPAKFSCLQSALQWGDTGDNGHLERLNQSLLVDEPSPGSVHDTGGRVHLPQQASRHNAFGRWIQAGTPWIWTGERCGLRGGSPPPICGQPLTQKAGLIALLARPVSLSGHPPEVLIQLFSRKASNQQSFVANVLN